VQERYSRNKTFAKGLSMEASSYCGKCIKEAHGSHCPIIIDDIVAESGESKESFPKNG
jgi:hypothetical protein